MNEIKDKLTLRQVALEFAVGCNGCCADLDKILTSAKKIESYILGDAELPEYRNPLDTFQKALDKFNEGCMNAKHSDIPDAPTYG